MNFRKKIFGSNNKKVIFLLVGWKSKIWRYYFVVLILLLSGFDCVAYEYDSDILSPDVKKTASSFDNVSEDILKIINEFKEKGYDDISLFGTSLGTLLSMIVVNKTKHVKKIVLNLTGASLAETVWSWEFMDKKKISLTSLDKSWKKLSPINNLDNVSDKQFLIYLAKNDEVIPYFQGIKLTDELRNRKIKYELVINKSGNHVLSVFLNLSSWGKYINFLKD